MTTINMLNSLTKHFTAAIDAVRKDTDAMRGKGENEVGENTEEEEK